MGPKMFACGGLASVLTIAAAVLAVFANISQINNNIVPRNFRMVTIDTRGAGAALGLGDAVYGSGPRTAAGSGLRDFYEWGLWTYSEKSGGLGGNADYIAPKSWAFEFRPVPAILFDVPQQAQTQVAQALPSGVFTSDSYLGRFTKAAFYLLFIGACLGVLALIIGFLSHRFAYLLAAAITFFAFLLEAVGCIIWTVIISRTKNSINDAGVGITVDYGVSLWLYWASTGCLFIAVLPYMLGCIQGRRDSYY